MNRYTDKFVKQIRLAHKNQGLSYSKLSKKFRIPSGTIRNWCHEDGLSRRDAITRTYQAKRDFFKKSEIACVPNLNLISKNEAKLLAGLLYGCEGSKYPSTNRMSFTNSDPNLVATFTKLIINGFDINPKRLCANLQIHTNQSHHQLKKFWAETLSLPDLKFGKPTITSPLGHKHRPVYKGTCTIRYNDYSLQLKLLGIFEKFIEELNTKEMV